MASGDFPGYALDYAFFLDLVLELQMDFNLLVERKINSQFILKSLTMKT
jgi:hypothetical protein